MNMEDMNPASINNLDSKRSVGSINYGLRIYGRSELQAASSCYLKGKSYDLIELKPPDKYLKYQKIVKTVNLLIEKSMGEPFVSSEELDSFMSNEDIPGRVKEDRFYTEVRYSRDISLFLLEASDVFDLKHKFKNFSITTYASNLKIYLSKVSSTAATKILESNRSETMLYQRRYNFLST